MTDWFRSWHGAPTDPKWLGIARKAGVAPGIAVAVAWALMDRASQAEDRGCVDGYDADGLACFYGCEPEQVDAIVAAMSGKGIIIEGRFTAWEKRQPKREDDSSQRVREYRERKKQHGERSVTPRNAPDIDTEEDTKANALGDEPSPLAPVYTDAKHELWGEGPPLLDALGVAKSQHRTLLGKWSKEAGDDAAGVLDAIRRARDARVQNPIAWISRAIPTRANHDRYHHNRPRSGADALLAAAHDLLGGQRLDMGRQAGSAPVLDAKRDGAGGYRFSG